VEKVLMQLLRVYYRLRSLLVSAGLYWWQYTTNSTSTTTKNSKKALATLAKNKKTKKQKKHLTKLSTFAMVAGLAHLRGWAGTNETKHPLKDKRQ